jgi:thioesterase domain-containing protein
LITGDSVLDTGERSVNTQELQAYLHEHIPLTQAMQISVLHATADGVTLSAPLAPNINHQETVFGGSASAVAILAAWALVHVRLRESGPDSRLVIQRNTITYERPMTSGFTARSSAPEPKQWDTFVRTLERRGRARILIRSVLECDGMRAGELEGEFVAFAERRGEAR